MSELLEFIGGMLQNLRTEDLFMIFICVALVTWTVLLYRMTGSKKKEPKLEPTIYVVRYINNGTDKTLLNISYNGAVFHPRVDESVVVDNHYYIVTRVKHYPIEGKTEVFLRPV